jgi:fumarate hydratase class I
MLLPLDIEALAWGWEDTRYRHLEIDGIDLRDGRLAIPPEALAELSRQAFREMAFRLPSSQLEAYARIIADPLSSANDRFVAAALIRNAAIAAEGVLPLCQDTGTACAWLFKGEDVRCGADASLAVAEGAVRCYNEENLRYSQLAPISMFEEADSGDNSPAQVEARVSAAPGMRLLFAAKGGGSANKTRLFQETKALLRPEALRAFMDAAIRSLGTAACPPYHVSMVVGGSSAEQNLTILKLSSAGFLGGLERPGPRAMGVLACPEWEEETMRLARASGLGAQFGGRALALGAQVLRLPRHAASLPVSIGLSCNAHRRIRAYVDAEGAWLERLEENPARFLGAAEAASPGAALSRIDLDRPMPAILADLGKLKAGDMVLLSGAVVVARDAVHARLFAEAEAGRDLPKWFLRHPIMYAGPAKKPAGLASGSLGPTTAGRMDAYAETFMSRGASLVSMAKGNRSEDFRLACQRHGGAYLGILGGAAALIAKEHVVSEEVLAYPELGMEAARLVRLRDLPAVLIIDPRGRDLYATRGT